MLPIKSTYFKLVPVLYFMMEFNKLDYLVKHNFLNNNRGILEKLSKNAKENSEKYSLQEIIITFKDLCKRIFKE